VASSTPLSVAMPKSAMKPTQTFFGSNSELRAIAEVYACDDAKQKVRA
jgi:catalase (peroxidase I)